MLEPTRYLLKDGEVLPFEDVNVHVLSPAVAYACTVFEGVCLNWNINNQELYAFRLKEHFDRLYNSMRVLRFNTDSLFNYSEFIEHLSKIITANNLRQDCHVRVLALLSGRGRPNITEDSTVNIVMAPSTYAQKDNRDKLGLHANISTWMRVSDQSQPPSVKTTANYVNGRLAAMEAINHGADVSIQLNQHGRVAESPTANLFMIKKGTLYTPPVSDSILEGITRETVLELATEELGINAVERGINRSELYNADEIFLCSSALGVVPIISVDKINLFSLDQGSITNKLSKEYDNCVRGLTHKYKNWLTTIYN